MGIAVVTGTSGQLGPIWCETLREMDYSIFEMDLPYYDVSIRYGEAIVGEYPYSVAMGKQICLADQGVPDVLVLNAAIDNPPGSEAVFHGDMERILQVNLVGAANVAASFIPSMIANNGGTIVVIGSIMGFVGADWRNYPPGFDKPVAYNLSKAALMQYVRSLTVQYGRHNIRACCIAFGPYDGGKLDESFLDKFLWNVPLGKPISKDSCKAALRFAVECPEFAGQTVLVDGGYTAW